MRQLEERILEDCVSIMLWSPKMDIIAIALETGEVVLYRLNFQKVKEFQYPNISQLFVYHVLTM